MSVTCSQCGTEVEDDTGLEPAERRPCPACGGTARTVHASASVAVRSKVTVSAEVIVGSMQSITAISDLLLQAVVVPGDKTDTGRLIEAVALPWFDIISLLERDPNTAFQIPAYRWEEIIAGSYRRAGLDEVILTHAAVMVVAMLSPPSAE